jgi:hypothetical protein
MKYILLLILPFAACSPCKRIAKLSGKHPHCFTQVKDTITYRDTFTLHDTIYTETKSDTFYLAGDTIIETKYIRFEKQGDRYKIDCKGDTIYNTKVINREVKVPYIKYVTKPFKNWYWLLISVIILLLSMLAFRRRN